jgi:hypothetical protein
MHAKKKPTKKKRERNNIELWVWLLRGCFKCASSSAVTFNSPILMTCEEV